MAKKRATSEVVELRESLQNVRVKLNEAQQRLKDANTTLHAIQSGSVDAVVGVDQNTGASHVLNIRGTEQPYRVFVEAVAEGALMINQDGIAIFCNRCFAQMLKTTPRKVLGKHVDEFFSPNEKDAIHHIITRGVTQKLSQEIGLLAVDGSMLQVLLSVSPLDTEELKGICILAADLSERHRTEAALHRALERARLVEDLKRALELRDEFLTIASHELKTPLTSLMMQLQSTKRVLDSIDHGPNQARFERSVDSCIRQGKRLIALIEDLLDVTQIQSGKLKLHPEETNLSHLVSETLERFEDGCEKSECHRILEPNVMGFIDPIRIDQVLSNLLNNAFKYAAGKPVEVKLQKKGKLGILTVRDQGIGISKEEQQRIFGRFERAVPLTNISGLGLGLYVVKQIVESHGGSVRLKSKKGKGATFRVEIPLLPRSRQENKNSHLF